MRKESTTSIMRRGFISTLAMCAAMLVSCSSENDIVNNNGVGENGEPELLGKGAYCTAEQQEPVDFDEESRSTMSLGPSGMLFSWETSDKLTLFTAADDATSANYNLSDDRGSDLKAFFTGTGFELLNGTVYYAISKKQGDDLTPAGCIFNTKKTLVFNYDGQRQTEDNSTEHLGKYDFMAASGECTKDNLVSLHFKHLGPTLRIIFEAPTNSTEADIFKAKRFTEMTIYASDNSFRQPDNRYIDLTQGLQLDNTYLPKWKDIDKTTDEYINAKPFTLKLGEEPVAPETDEMGFTPNASTGKLSLFMMIPPENFSGKNIVFTLKATDGSEYYMSCAGKDLDPSKAYQFKGVAKKATQFAVTLRVNHLWQHGDEEDVNSRATGDPGYDKKIILPTNIYYIFCVDGKVKKVNEKAWNSITDIPESYWSKDPNTSISTYKGSGSSYQFTFSVSDAESDVPKNVYFIASKDALPALTFENIAEGVEESEVQALTYSIQGATQDASQNFLRDLYSTPYVNTGSFTGHLTGVEKDVFLYHVAAKVDLKWNSAAAATSVGVSGVQKTGLSLFKPTTNSGSGDYYVSTTNSIGTQWNGRQVYYLPQFANNRYNVTIGAKNYPTYEFTDVSTEGGYTSWYRALIKQ